MNRQLLGAYLSAAGLLDGDATAEDFLEEIFELCLLPVECTDLASIDPLTEESLVEMVRARYEEAKIRPFGGALQHTLIYTRAGPVVVAVNPLCPVPDLYTAALRKKYHRMGKKRGR